MRIGIPVALALALAFFMPALLYLYDLPPTIGICLSLLMLTIPLPPTPVVCT